MAKKAAKANAARGRNRKQDPVQGDTLLQDQGTLPLQAAQEGPPLQDQDTLPLQDQDALPLQDQDTLPSHSLQDNDDDDVMHLENELEAMMEDRALQQAASSDHAGPGNGDDTVQEDGDKVAPHDGGDAVQQVPPCAGDDAVQQVPASAGDHATQRDGDQEVPHDGGDKFQQVQANAGDDAAPPEHRQDAPCTTSGQLYQMVMVSQQSKLEDELATLVADSEFELHFATLPLDCQVATEPAGPGAEAEIHEDDVEAATIVKSRLFEHRNT